MHVRTLLRFTRITLQMPCHSYTLFSLLSF